MATGDKSTELYQFHTISIQILSRTKKSFWDIELGVINLLFLFSCAKIAGLLELTLSSITGNNKEYNSHCVNLHKAS
ncbi:hypothetical protein J5893_02155 [bacterium]|nr:hypothetical protein [bacterium]